MGAVTGVVRGIDGDRSCFRFAADGAGARLRTLSRAGRGCGYSPFAPVVICDGDCLALGEQNSAALAVSVARVTCFGAGRGFGVSYFGFAGVVRGIDITCYVVTGNITSAVGAPCTGCIAGGITGGGGRLGFNRMCMLAVFVACIKGICYGA